MQKGRFFMEMPISPSAVSGSVAVPGSKSHTIRAIVSALLAEGTSRIIAPLRSEDTASALRAALALGAELQQDSAEGWEIRGTGGKLRTPAKLDFGNSGTGMRLLCAVSCLGTGEVVFDGDDSLRRRPMEPLLAALTQLGAHCRSQKGFAPCAVQGPMIGGVCTVSGESSQYLSALLFAAPFTEKGAEISLKHLNEKPYVEITLDTLRRFGIACEAAEDRLHYRISGNQYMAAFTRVIPADFSSAAFPLGAGLLAAGEAGVTIRHLDFQDVQGDKALFFQLKECGGDIRFAEDSVTVFRSALKGGTFDLNATPDALPLFAAVAAAQEGEEFRLINTPQARIKETDRIACMRAELVKMGADVTELPDGLIIRGAKLHGAALESYGDHRIAMALAVAALAADSASVIHGTECAAVTYPTFWSDLRILRGC